MAPGDPGDLTRAMNDHKIRLTNLTKTMYPDTGMTKEGVIDYYTAVAEVLLPQLRNRVVTRIRYPDGIGGERFFEKNTPKSMPEWIRRFTISASPGTGQPAKQVRYPVIDDVAGLIWMANQAALELHTPQWRVGPRGGVRKLDRLVIDLDPGEGVGLDACAEIALLVADRLRAEGMEPVPVTSGGKGIHVYAVVNGARTALAIHGYVQGLGRELAAEHPDRIVAVQDKSKRIGKVMIDWSQNHPARSTATPYTLRGQTAPTVAAPRSWDEITTGLKQLSPDDVIERLRRDGDLMMA